MTITAPARPAVSAAYRTDILAWASCLLHDSERHHAGLVTSAAAPLLDWVAQAAGQDDARNRMRALRQQHQNTPPAGMRARDASGRWVPVPALTPGEFLAETGKLYAFIAAGGE